MFKKIIKVSAVILLSGFSFFYTEKVTKIIRNKDPIMVKILNEKDNNFVQTIKPIINNDEYITGINGCEIDINKSYDKMKTFGEYKEELLVMKEAVNKDLKDKYIIGGNKLEKKVSVLFFINDDINNELINFLSKKNIKSNFFVSQDYLENNTFVIKFLSSNNNIYYLGKDFKYIDEYMIYSNNLVEMNSNNRSNYCILENKNDEYLKICTDYNMKVIKTDYIKNDILLTIKENLSNGKIIAIDSNDIEKIKVSLNYIITKGYDIVTLDELLNENNKCDKRTF